MDLIANTLACVGKWMEMDCLAVLYCCVPFMVSFGAAPCPSGQCG